MLRALPESACARHTAQQPAGGPGPRPPAWGRSPSCRTCRTRPRPHLECVSVALTPSEPRNTNAYEPAGRSRCPLVPSPSSQRCPRGALPAPATPHCPPGPPPCSRTPAPDTCTCRSERARRALQNSPFLCSRLNFLFLFLLFLFFVGGLDTDGEVGVCVYPFWGAVS